MGPGSRPEYEAEHDWPTTVRLPAYSPDQNPIEGIWSRMRRAMGQHRLQHTRRSRPGNPPPLTGLTVTPPIPPWKTSVMPGWCKPGSVGVSGSPRSPQPTDVMCCGRWSRKLLFRRVETSTPLVNRN
ncbi:transposase [Streptomyces chryseus]